MLGGESAFAPKVSVKIRRQRGGIPPKKHAQGDQAASAEILAMVKTFWMSAPVRTPKILMTESVTTSRTASKLCVLKPTSMLPNTIGPNGMEGHVHMPDPVLPKLQGRNAQELAKCYGYGCDRPGLG